MPRTPYGIALIFVAVATWIVAALAGVPAHGAAPDASERGRAAMVQAGCTLCHAVAATPTAARTDGCASCHAWIRAVAANPDASAAAREVFPAWDRYARNVHTYLAVPSLDAAAARLDPAWVRRYLADPYDLRPAMSETMVRANLAPADLDAIVGWFAARQPAVPASPAPDPSRVARGEVVYAQAGCGACHTFGARPAAAGAPVGPGLATAPDLRHARDRLDPDHALAWIVSPGSLSAEATMPTLPLSAADALAVRDYVLLAEPGGVVATARTGPRFAASEGAAVAAPRWEDVEVRVFSRVCVHCHMDPAQNEGRAGPGNEGGFGWPATGIELQRYESVVAARDRVLAALDRKERETARDAVGPGQVPAATGRPERPGMPLGLPALDPRDVAMVRAWYAAGAPR